MAKGSSDGYVVECVIHLNDQSLSSGEMDTFFDNLKKQIAGWLTSDKRVANYQIETPTVAGSRSDSR